MHPSLVDGADRVGGVGVAREEDAPGFGCTLCDPREKLDAGHAGHALIGDDQIESGALEHLPGLAPRLGHLDVSNEAQDASDEFQTSGLIIYGEDRRAPGHDLAYRPCEDFYVPITRLSAFAGNEVSTRRT